MTRERCGQPAHQFHVSGLASVTLNGEDIYQRRHAGVREPRKESIVVERVQRQRIGSAGCRCATVAAGRCGHPGQAHRLRLTGRKIVYNFSPAQFDDSQGCRRINFFVAAR